MSANILMIVLYTVLCGISIKTAYAVIPQKRHDVQTQKQHTRKQHMCKSHKNSMML